MRKDNRSTKPRKLALATQTVRALENATLEGVAGAATGTLCYRISVGLCD